MDNMMFELDTNCPLSLQEQIRQKILDAIFLDKVLRPGGKLPATRALSSQLNVSRNTVILAYNRLIDEGHLISHKRSGVYVSPNVFHGHLQDTDKENNTCNSDQTLNKQDQKITLTEPSHFESSLINWPSHPYPFLNGKYDDSLIPISEWRESVRLSLAGEELKSWASEIGINDDPFLIEQLRTKLLPRRGVYAHANEILVVDTPQQALYLVASTLFSKGDNVAVENPGNPHIRDILNTQGINTIPQPIDEFGIVVDSKLDHVSGVYVTPSHQLPTSVTMSPERRKSVLNAANKNGFHIIEDDLDGENNYVENPHPALKSIDKHDAVIYLTRLTNILCEKSGISLIVAPKEFIENIRAARSVILGDPSANNQRALAYFLSLGHYESMLKKRFKILEKRWLELHAALCFYFNKQISVVPTHGGAALWIKVDEDIDCYDMCTELAKSGVLLEMGSRYFMDPSQGKDYFRISVTAVPADNIRQGVRIIADYIQQKRKTSGRHLYKDTNTMIPGNEIEKKIRGKQIICKSLYGDNYVMEALSNGDLQGHLTYYDDEYDQGRWWIEENFWCRKWNSWAFGEIGKYLISIKNNQIFWHDENGLLVDSGFLKDG